MVNDSNIITIDSIESKMKVNKFSGNHSQETREGYNLWDYLNVVKASAGGLTIEKDYENGYITVNGTPNESYVHISSSIFITDMLEDGQKYTLWQEIYGGEGTTDGIYLQVTRTDDNGTTRYYSLSNSVTFLVDKSNNASYSITLQTSTIDGTATLTNYRNRYMLYKGTDEKSYELPGASPSINYPSEIKAVGDNGSVEVKKINKNFEEHQEQSYILDIQKPMLLGDYFDLERGKEVHKWIERELTGTENITLTDTVNGIAQFTFSQFYDGDYDTGSVNINALSNCYKGVPYQSSWLKDNSISLVGGYAPRIMTSEYSTVEEFKQMLARKYAEGNPVRIYYKLIKPKELDLTEEQITVLNQLQNIILYDDTTNIILPDVYPILDYDVSKIIDTTTTFEASLDSNGYFVVPDYDIKCLVSYSESDIPSMPEAVETSVNIPGRDGDIPLNTTYNPIPFNIVCYTEDNLTPEEKYAEETKMNKFLNSIKNNTIKLKLENKGKYYDVKYNGQLTTINYPKHLQFSIPLKSSSSYAKDIDEYYILGNGEEESDTIKEVGAVFVIEGPAQTPKISLNDYEMFYDNVLLSNTKLVIDSNKSTVTMINREGTATNAMRYYNHEFPKIQNGNNVLKVLSGIDEDRQVNVRWFDLKL